MENVTFWIILVVFVLAAVPVPRGPRGVLPPG
jgi:hypothetical protein